MSSAFPLARAVRSLLASDETFPVFQPPTVPENKVGVERCLRKRWVGLAGLARR